MAQADVNEVIRKVRDAGVQTYDGAINIVVQEQSLTQDERAALMTSLKKVFGSAGTSPDHHPIRAVMI